MKRKALLILLILNFLFPLRAGGEEEARRGLFVSVIQDPPVFASREGIAKLVDFAKGARINTLFVQIYRANQAWFPSDIADAGPYAESLASVGEDPVRLLIDLAHDEGIEVHAWLNMLSLAGNRDAPILAKYGPGILTRNTKKKRALGDYLIDNQYFLEPGDLRVRDELAGVVAEILRAYPDLDGVEFDYVRYPDKNPAYGYTDMNTGRFREETGSRTIGEGIPAWEDWKRSQVTATLESLARTARTLSPGIQVSATGCMPYARAQFEAFQDWTGWLEGRIVDFVTIMSYSPFPDEFTRWVRGAKKKTAHFDRVLIDVGAYKMAGMPGDFEKELSFCAQAGRGGFVVFHYGSLLQNPALAASVSRLARAE